MSKPAALTESELDEIAIRLTKGWVVRYDTMRALIAMARERNQYVAAAGVTKAADPNTYGAMGYQVAGSGVPTP